MVPGQTATHDVCWRSAVLADSRALAASAHHSVPRNMIPTCIPVCAGLHGEQLDLLATLQSLLEQ